MKINPSFVVCHLIAASFLIGLTDAIASSQLTFTDTWKDTGDYNAAGPTYVKTVGSFSTTISLPLNGVDLSEADSGTMFTLAIGPAGSTTQIVSDTLGDAESFSASKRTAKFAVMDPNSGATIGSVTVSWAGTTIAVTGSATEDILGEEETFAAESNDTPTNYSLNSSINGYYEAAVTLDASDNGGGTYSYDNPYLQTTGSDKETEYNAPDGSGLYPLEAGSITGTADFTPPKLSISSPPASFKVYNNNAIVDLIGLSSDSEGITNIQCFVNGDLGDSIAIDQSDELPTNSISWTAEVDLSQFGQAGGNLITVMAQDLSGNQTSVSRTYFWIETNSAAVTVNPPNAGTIKGIKNNQVLQAGAGYAGITATPANKAWLFSEWTDDMGDVLSSNATFEYIDTDGALTANFVANPFYNTSLAGTYLGLFFDGTNAVTLDDAGYITLTVTGTGGYSGKLYLASDVTPFSLSGQLAMAPDDSSGSANFNIKVTKSLYLNGSLQVATDTNLSDTGAGTITGFVNSFSDSAETNQLDSAEVQAELSLYNKAVVPGSYNIVIAPAGDPSQAPGGYSYGTATVSKTGAVALALTLADGVSPAISFSSSMARDGTCPFYASLYGGDGVIFGWLQFGTDGSGGVQGNSVNWLKMPEKGKFYSDGYDSLATLAGGLYVPPKAGTNVFGVGTTALTFAIDPGFNGVNLPNETDLSVTYNPVKNTFSDTSKVTITLTPATGALTGTFYPAGSKTATTFHGIVSFGAGYGYYTSPLEETGPISIGSNVSIVP